MSGSSAQASEPVPSCLKCGRSMVRRTARRGANVGNEFWECSEYPRCRCIPVDCVGHQNGPEPRYVNQVSHYPGRTHETLA